MNLPYKTLLFLSFCFLPKLVSCVQAVNKYDGISISEATTLANEARKKTDFPIVMNQSVMHYLDKFLSKPSGRIHLKQCLKRMKAYQKRITSTLNEMDLPLELMAIPVIESGYQNIHSENATGSGLWMLIKSTAKAKGLKIDGSKDERLNVERSTEVALAYLKNNYKVLKDWHLTLLAYNLGESKVRWAMLETNSRDAWALIDQGYERDKGYLAKLMAVIIIMKNPEVLN